MHELSLTSTTLNPRKEGMVSCDLAYSELFQWPDLVAFNQHPNLLIALDWGVWHTRLVWTPTKAINISIGTLWCTTVTTIIDYSFASSLRGGGLEAVGAMECDFTAGRLTGGGGLGGARDWGLGGGGLDTGFGGGGRLGTLDLSLPTTLL